MLAVLRGNRYDDAAMEYFWRTLNIKLLYRKKLDSRSDVRLALFHYIHVLREGGV